jgi:hypothetical protein
MAEMIAVARATEDPNDLVLARYFESFLEYLLRDASRAMAAAREAVALCEEHRFAFPGAMLQGILRWAQAQVGVPDVGVSLVRRNSTGFVESSSGVMFAEAQVLHGAIDDALRTLEDALQANPEELIFQPNILTRRGELRSKTGLLELAEVDFREAIDRAQKMEAKALELRAATGLARMLRARGDRAAARDLLAAVYSWFTEGFDTADLRDARALLDELSR